MNTPLKTYERTLDIHTGRNDCAPPDERWSAWIGEYDVGKQVFNGPTQRAAVDVLLDFCEDADGDIHA